MFTASSANVLYGTWVSQEEAAIPPDSQPNLDGRNCEVDPRQRGTHRRKGDRQPRLGWRQSRVPSDRLVGGSNGEESSVLEMLIRPCATRPASRHRQNTDSRSGIEEAVPRMGLASRHSISWPVRSCAFRRPILVLHHERNEGHEAKQQGGFSGVRRLSSPAAARNQTL